MSRPPDTGAFDRAATRIGDLDNPLYAEERHRDVWNEASAVGFQLLLWGLLAAAAVLSFVQGPPAAVPVLTMLGLAALAVVVAVTHAARSGVEVAFSAQPDRGWRGALAGGLLGVIPVSLMEDLTGAAYWWVFGAIVVGAGASRMLDHALRRRARTAAGDAEDPTD